MKLVPKLTLALVAAMSTILAVNGLLRVRREVTTHDVDAAHDRDLVGASLASAVEAIWRTDGKAAALAVVDAAARGNGRLALRWRSPGGAPAALSPCTVVPVSSVDPAHGSVEVCEKTDTEQRYVRATIFETVETTSALALVSALLAIVLGGVVVGRPVRALVDKARRIGEGDFHGPLALDAADELVALASEMNTSADRLARANAQVAIETERRIAALEALRHADRLATVGKLASGIAHELGTPLNVVSARASLIATREAVDEEAVRSAKVVLDAAERMTRIIRQLLEFARRKGPVKATSDVVGLAASTLELLRAVAAKKNVSLHLRGDAPAMAAVDSSQIQQAITNLVMNAIQALPRGGDVEVSVERTKAQADDASMAVDYVRVRVHDEGVGIAPDVLPHVFEPFFTTKDVGEGTGLGLSVAYGIVQDHGGFLDATSDARGTTFSLYVPIGGA